MKHVITFSTAIALAFFIACTPSPAPESESAVPDNVPVSQAATPGAPEAEPAAPTAPLESAPPVPPPKNGPLRGFVFEDTNGNAEPEASEPRLSGMTMKLQTPDRKKDLATTTTDESGAFRFADRTPGEYRLTIIVPPGFVRSGDDSFPLQLHPDGTSNEAHFGLARN